MKKKDPMYEITPKGVVMLKTEDEETASAIMEALELQALRHGSNAMIIVDGAWQFVKVRRDNA
jgi:hypothetical protein